MKKIPQTWNFVASNSPIIVALTSLRDKQLNNCDKELIQNRINEEMQKIYVNRSTVNIKVLKNKGLLVKNLYL